MFTYNSDYILLIYFCLSEWENNDYYVITRLHLCAWCKSVCERVPVCLSIRGTNSQCSLFNLRERVVNAIGDNLM